MTILISQTAPTMIEAGEASITASGGQGNVAMKIFIAGVLLVVTSIALKRWLYPFVIEDLEREMRSIFKILQDNTTLEFDLLGDCAWRFRARLDVYVLLFCRRGDIDKSFVTQRI